MTTLRYALYILALTLGILGCKDQTEKTAGNPSVGAPNVVDSVKLRALKKLFATADFDGDGRGDTIFQHTFSRLTRTEIDNSADPSQNEWDVVVKWFFDRDADVYLTLHKNDYDTLRLGPAQGLYCLINIGDINADGKDEIALVIDHLDFSSVNSCRIYSLCNNKWTLLKQFGVHEDAFNFTAAKTPNFDSIKGYLEKQNGTWTYRYSQADSHSAEDAGMMLPLKLDRCK